MLLKAAVAVGRFGKEHVERPSDTFLQQVKLGL
jgi:hypothetical protein